MIEFYGTKIESIDELFTIGKELIKYNRNIEYEEMREDILSKAKEYKETNKLDKGFLEKIWIKGKSNGIAKLPSNGISKDEFQKIFKELEKLTRFIADNNSPKAYIKVEKEFKKLNSKGKVRNFYPATIARVFCTFHPDEHINWVVGKNINAAKRFFLKFDEFERFNKKDSDWFNISTQIRKILNDENQKRKRPFDDEDVRRIASYFIDYYINKKENYFFQIEDVDLTSREGKPLYVLHKRIERNSAISKKKKNNALKENKLKCEVCGFDFYKVYGDRGHGYIECHHKKPLSELRGETDVKLKDLSLLCANCHRIIHRKKPYISVSELKGIYRR